MNQTTEQPQPIDGSIPLKGRKELFAQEYVKTANGAQAYQNVYHNNHSNPAEAGSKLKSLEPVYKRILFLQGERAKEAKIDAKWVLDRLVKNAESAQRDFDKNKALELIGKHLSMFVDRVKIEGLPKRIIIRSEDGSVAEELGSNKKTECSADTHQ